jgi:hypothetical protein
VKKLLSKAWRNGVREMGYGIYSLTRWHEFFKIP